MTMINVAQISRGDLLGGRFNGYSIKHLLAERGVHSSHLAFEPRSDDPAVSRVFAYPGSGRFVSATSRWEQRLGLHSMLQLHSFGLPANSVFRRADVVHYHIIHDGFFSIAALPLLARLKPSVWTWHDPWIMTGHCTYPMGCERWRVGCGECPDLKLPFPMRFDNTRQAFALKRRIVRNSPIDIVIASHWMLDMAGASPVAQNARLHHIPFGVDLDRFTPRNPAEARERLGVRPGYVVIATRGYNSPFKGVEEFAAALEQLETPVCVLSLHDVGAFDRMIGRHQVIGLDWTDDEDALIEAYTAADFFVMPSTAEAFGLMAVEAMACGRPVVSFEGTSLSDVTFAPESGISVPMRDVRALADAVQHLVDDRQDRQRRGRRARELAEQHYPATLYADRLASLYKALAQGRAHSTVPEGQVHGESAPSLR